MGSDFTPPLKPEAERSQDSLASEIMEKNVPAGLVLGAGTLAAVAVDAPMVVAGLAGALAYEAGKAVLHTAEQSLPPGRGRSALRRINEGIESFDKSTGIRKLEEGANKVVTTIISKLGGPAGP